MGALKKGGWNPLQTMDEECKQKYLHEHVLQDDHHGFFNDAQVTLIDKTQASDPTKRVFLDENPGNTLPIWF